MAALPLGYRALIFTPYKESRRQQTPLRGLFYCPENSFNNSALIGDMPFACRSTGELTSDRINELYAVFLQFPAIRPNDLVLIHLRVHRRSN